MNQRKLILTAAFVILLFPAIFYVLLTRGKNEYAHLPVAGKIGKEKLEGYHLSDQKQNLITTKNFKDKYLVAGFYLMNADTLNETLNSQLRKVQRKFADAGDVRILSFIVPFAGAPSSSQAAAKEGAIYGSWYFSLPGNDSIMHVIANDFKIQMPVDSMHTFKTVYLLDKNGNIRGVHDGTDSWAMDTLADEIKLLRWEEWDKQKKAMK